MMIGGLLLFNYSLENSSQRNDGQISLSQSRT